MKSVMIFGKNSPIREQKSNRDFIQVENNQVFIESHNIPANHLLKEFLGDLLHSQIFKIYDQVKDEEKFEVFGNLDFEIVDKIDNKKRRIAKIKGNKILVKLNAVVLPESALKYVIVHEIAHIFTKRHTNRFWKIVKTIYPDFEVGQNLLNKYEEFVSDSFDGIIT